MYGIYANIWGILMGSMLPYIAYMDPMGIWLTKYHSDSLSLCWFSLRYGPFPEAGKRHRSKATGGRRDEQSMGLGPQRQRLVEGKNTGTMATIWIHMIFDHSKNQGFPQIWNQFWGNKHAMHCDASNRKHVKTTNLGFGGCQLCSSSARCSVQSIHRFFARRWGSNFQVDTPRSLSNWLWSIWWYTLGWVGWWKLANDGGAFEASRFPRLPWMIWAQFMNIYIIIYQEFSRDISIYFPDISSGCMFFLGRKGRLKPSIFWGTRSEAGCTATSKVTVFNTTTEEVERCRCSLTRLTRLTRFCWTV